ncbi:hypothetical protein I5523_17785 [Acinetobacter oleivorans]|uniref:hypothetical protein n=1 Tax=Acinetobacter oleivorans TaxID=1148157 RepID=UPI0018FF83B7|nr:hypothetical protein [Acinetobacter oleivorans]MBJ9741486.1 hypothetical protein [Acinetobacter oleivorans]MCU4411174.1 hypothetical protein [Acinetobacter oleivorans]
MTKIVQAVNAMISNPDKIKSVIPNGQEFFFIYKDRYKWSIIKNDQNDYLLFYYAENISLDEIANISNNNWQQLQFVKYSASEIKTREATESFSELYTIVSEKAYGIDEMFKDIIADMDEDLPF